MGSFIPFAFHSFSHPAIAFVESYPLMGDLFPFTVSHPVASVVRNRRKASDERQKAADYGAEHTAEADYRMFSTSAVASMKCQGQKNAWVVRISASAQFPGNIRIQPAAVRIQPAATVSRPAVKVRKAPGSAGVERYKQHL